MGNECQTGNGVESATFPVRRQGATMLSGRGCSGEWLELQGRGSTGSSRVKEVGPKTGASNRPLSS